MQIKDHTFRLRLKHFIIVLIGSSSIMAMLKYHENDYGSQKFDLWDFFLVTFLACISACGLTKTKLKIKEIESKEKPIDWFNDYFYRHKAKKIFESNQQLIYQIEKKRKYLLLFKGNEYYNISLNDNNAIITGPLDKKPKFIHS